MNCENRERQHLTKLKSMYEDYLKTINAKIAAIDKQQKNKPIMDCGVLQ